MAVGAELQQQQCAAYNRWGTNQHRRAAVTRVRHGSRTGRILDTNGVDRDPAMTRIGSHVLETGLTTSHLRRASDPSTPTVYDGKDRTLALAADDGRSLAARPPGSSPGNAHLRLWIR